MRPLRIPAAARAMTLTEVLIAGSLLAFMTGAIVASLLYSSKASRLNANALMAKNVAQGYFERMNSDVFANVGPAKYPNIAYDSDPPLYLDQGSNVRCEVDIAFTGFGVATGGSASSVTDSLAHWRANEWAGSVLYLVDGMGIGQFLPIVSNTADTLSVQGAFNPVPVANSTKYMINNGKTVRVTTRWEYLGKTYTQSIGSLIVNYRNAAELGF